MSCLSRFQHTSSPLKLSKTSSLAQVESCSFKDPRLPYSGLWPAFHSCPLLLVMSKQNQTCHLPTGNVLHGQRISLAPPSFSILWPTSASVALDSKFHCATLLPSNCCNHRLDQLERFLSPDDFVTSPKGSRCPFCHPTSYQFSHSDEFPDYQRSLTKFRF